MFVRLLFSLFLVLVVYFDSSRIEKKSTLKERCQTVFNPAGIMRIFILYPVLLMFGTKGNVLQKSISFLFSFAVVSFIVFSLTSFMIGKLREKYEAKTVSSLWLLPNLLYFNFYWALSLPIFRPFFVLCIDHETVFRFIMIAWFVIGSLILNKTHFGRNVYALGSNPDAVALSGVSVAKMRIAVFALAGLFFGIAQIVNIGKIGSAANSMGIGAEFTVMAGAMLGGVKMGGGGGKMSNMVVGVLIIAVLNQGMNFLNINQYWQYVALGIVLLAAVTLDTLQTRAAINAAKKVSGTPPKAAQA